jgi:hypothetical protein
MPGASEIPYLTKKIYQDMMGKKHTNTKANSCRRKRCYDEIKREREKR